MAMDNRNTGILTLLNRVKPWLRPVLSILISVWILHKLLARYGPIQDIKVFSNLNRFLLILFFTGLLSIILTAARKIQKLIEAFTIRPKLSKVLQNLLVSAALNSIVPGRLGDLYRLNLIARTPLLTTSPFLIVAFERYLNMGVIFSLVAIASAFGTGQHQLPVFLISFFLVILQILILLILSKRQYQNRVLISLYRLSRTVLEHPGQLIQSIGWGCISWGLNMVMLSLALHASFPFSGAETILTAGAIGIAAGLFPIGLNGLGIREAALIFFFPSLDPVGVIKAGLLYFSCTTIPMIIAGAALFLFHSGFNIKKNQSLSNQ